MDWITNNSMLMLQKGLDYTWQKQRVISENIANVETPGYKAKYLTFEDELRQRLWKVSNSKTSGKITRHQEIRDAIGSSRFTVRDTDVETTKLDGNNVNIDVEGVELARAEFQYEYLVKQINDQFSRLRTVIQGR